MISDVLSDAVHAIDEYLDEEPLVYREQIVELRNRMEAMREALDDRTARDPATIFAGIEAAPG